MLCGEDAAHDVVCAACSADLPRLEASGCPQCALPQPASAVCPACVAHPPAFDRSYAAFRYAFPIDRLVHALKYRHRLPLALWAARQLAERLTGQSFDALVPVPLHPDRLRERGFNQAGEIARHLKNRLLFPVDRRSLQRTRDTHRQSDLSPRERARNLGQAFSATSRLDGRHLLLIDDVMTTGATANACARVLKAAGAASVTVAVLARTPKDC